MLLTNNQNNTMRQYCGRLPGMTHVQSKPEKNPRNSIDWNTPCSKNMFRNVNRTCQAFDMPSSWLSLSLSLSLSAFDFLYQDKRWEE